MISLTLTHIRTSTKTPSGLARITCERRGGQQTPATHSSLHFLGSAWLQQQTGFWIGLQLYSDLLPYNLAYSTFLKPYRTVGSEDKGPQEVSSPISCWSRVRPEARPDCSGLCPIRVWNPPRMELPQQPWAASSNAQLSSWGKAFSYNQPEPVLFQFMPAVSSSSYSPLWQVWFHLLDVPIGSGGCFWSHPKAIPSPGWSSSAPSVSPHRASAPTLSILVALHRSHFSLPMSYSKLL